MCFDSQFEGIQSFMVRKAWLQEPQAADTLSPSEKTVGELFSSSSSPLFLFFLLFTPGFWPMRQHHRHSQWLFLLRTPSKTHLEALNVCLLDDFKPDQLTVTINDHIRQ